MINRVLIRIKVVQTLYSYILVENPFSLLSQPSAPTKEKRFAYALYLDTLMLMAQAAERIQRRDGTYPLLETRFMRCVLADDKIKSLRQKYLSSDFPFRNIVDNIADNIKESAIYKKFIKSDDSQFSVEDNVWKNIFDHIIVNNPEFNAIVSTRENFTIRGVDRMRAMIEETFTDLFASADHLPDALKTLDLSFSKARELYFRLLAIPVELTALREKIIDDASRKHLKTAEDINPNLRMVENEFVKALANDPEYHQGVSEFNISWLTEDEILMRQLLKAVMESDIYREYMDFPATDFKADCEFWREILKNVIFRNPAFLETLEDKSVFWNDDLDVIGTFVLKTIRRYAQEGEASAILPKFKDQEDAEFGEKLFTAVIKNKTAYRQLINSVLDNKSWDSDRLAFMDVIIIMTAVAEILNFPKIPLTVSINEYIEIAKSYSSAKSGYFVNGLLATIVAKLQTDGTLQKV